MLKVENLSRRFGKKMAIRDINFDLGLGIYGLLGDNGAGKTSLMRLLVGVDRPSNGKIFWKGEEIQKLGPKYRQLLGYMPQEFSVFPSFTAKEFLYYMGALKGLGKKDLKLKVAQVFEFVNLIDVQDKRVNQFSGGMKRRLGIAQAILNDPKILVLDEPTAGLDPGERIRFSNLISKMSRNKIILFSTHIISDIEAITNNIIILNDGYLQSNTQTDCLVKEMENQVFEVFINFDDLKNYETCVRIIRMRHEDHGLRLRYTGKRLAGSYPVQANLEDYYVFNRRRM